jgi:TonB family protein
MAAATLESFGLRPFYRQFELPWATDDEQENRFRKLWLGLLAAVLVLGFIVMLVPVPERTGPLATSVPPRLAKVMIEKEIPPPPPPPPPPEVKVDTPPPPTETKPEPRPKDRQIDDQARTRKAREQANQAGLVALRDELADIRQQFEFNKDQLKPTANTTGEVDGPSKAERSLITSKIGTASGGISSTGQSRGFGAGAGNLGGHSTTQVVATYGGSGAGSSSIGRGADGVRRSGQSGKGSRSREEIELVFDRNKGAIYALYSRALREKPDLQGKMVLEFTIAPTGEVTMCRVVSSELKDEELERRIVTKVKSFRFDPKDVETITTTKPIDFFPA